MIDDKLAMFAAQPSVSPLYASSGNSPWAVRYSQELKDVVIRYAERLPRNVQRHLGPSELGHACDRQLVGKMAGVSFGGGGGNRLNDPWASIVGTALHAFFDQAFTWDSERGRNLGRWLSETRVTPDPGAAQPHPGTADLFDKLYLTLTDHKGVALDTRIPTPSGWTTMGELREGDEVFGADGLVSHVVKAYPVQLRDCYRVTFTAGDSIVVDDVQEFTVSRNRNGGWSTSRQEIVTLSAVELREQLRCASGQRHLRIVNPCALELPDAELPVHPYVLGCWLGDGDRHGGQITKPDEELFDNIVSFGYAVGNNITVQEGMVKRTVFGLLAELQAAGLVRRVQDSALARGERYEGVKRIPLQYLRASRAQRLHLLQGLMDTDGSWNKRRNQAVFTTTDAALASQVRELALTLGWKAYTCDFEAHGFGVTTTAYQVMFTPVGVNPFLLPRKAQLVRLQGAVKSRYRIVQSVEPVDSVPTRCIDVDAPDHLYLAGDFFLPVHNCQSEAIRARLRSAGPPYHYRIQMLLYALGYMHQGYDVRRIVLASWPRTKSTLTDMYVWEHEITVEDLREVSGVLDKTALREQLAGYVASGALSFWDVPAAPSIDDCEYCPYFSPGAMKDRTALGCPGNGPKSVLVR